MVVKRVVVALAALLVVSIPGAFAQDAGSAKSSDIAGTYTLVSVDGKTLPYTHPEGVVIRSGSFTIGSDGTCSSRIAFTLPNGAESSREVRATYTREGRTLTMNWEGAGTTTGTVEGSTFSMSNEGLVLAYRK
jgi:hypothetical protein